MDLELKKALSFHQSGRLNEAEKIYLEILSGKSNDPGILQLLGTLYLQKKNFESSKKYLQKSLAINPNNPATLNNLGNLEKIIGNYFEADKYFQLNIDKNNFLSSWINKSNLLIQNEKYKEGLEFIELSLKKYPNDSKLKNNYALSLFNCGHIKKSLDIYKDFDNNNSHFPDSLINYSKVLFQMKLFDNSLKVINKLLNSTNKNVEALRQRFLIYKSLDDYLSAEQDILDAYRLDVDDVTTNKMIVDFFIHLKKFTEAINYCDQMLIKNKESSFFIVRKISCKLHSALWNDFNDDLEYFNDNKEKIVFSPLDIKYFSDDAFLHKELAEIHWQLKSKINHLTEIKDNKISDKQKKKVRIGYFSGDFRDHAVFHLIQDLFLNHNKSIFEIYCYSSFKKDGPERNKIIEYADYFFDINDKLDDEVLNLIKSHNLDIAIDLSGYTQFSKSEFFKFDISKIKLNYLGYPGTMGTDKYDYIIADKIIIPEEHKKFYSEKVLYLSENYQPFTPIPFETNIDRSIYDLPKDAFILGCLSRVEKILPSIFSIWMNILKKYKDTYLALYISNEEIKQNIKNFCKENKFDFDRILFLSHISHNENLKRISTFNLYLDTFPYNGHTAISDALFQSCVPTISLNGKSFASRVSMSLLNSLNLLELITTDENKYYDKIDYFCSNREALINIKKKLLNYKKNNLNRMQTFTKDFENLMLRLVN